MKYVRVFVITTIGASVGFCVGLALLGFIGLLP